MNQKKNRQRRRIESSQEMTLNGSYTHAMKLNFIHKTKNQSKKIDRDAIFPSSNGKKIWKHEMLVRQGGNTHSLLVGMRTSAATVEASLAACIKITNAFTLSPRNFTSQQVSHRYPHIHLKWHMYKIIHSSIICNSRE